MTCSCASAGFCAVFNQQMPPRLWRICQGDLLTPEKCAAYRANWTEKNLAKRPECLQIGEVQRLQDCPSCCGKVKLKVFACALHGECTPAKELPGVACCVTCAQYEPPATALAPPPPDGTPELRG